MTHTTKRSLPAFDHRWALFLDVDGTLVDFVEHPDQLRSDAELIGVLDEIYRSSGGALALVSGRTIESVDAVFDPLRLPTAGVHGHERRDGSGRIQREPVDERILSDARARLERLVAQRPGTFVEDKGRSVALHYRRAPDAAGAAEALAREMETSLPEPFCVQRGKMVVEIRPCTHSKGSAIAAFMGEAPFAGRTPVFVGDDATDEHGFEWINMRDGFSIKVGEGATSAQFRIEAVRDVVHWLEDYAAFLGRAGNGDAHVS